MTARALAVAAALLALVPATAGAATTSQSPRFTASDGVSLQTTVTGAAPLSARPTIVEFSPYGRNTQNIAPGPDFNLLLVQIRGTGDSDGRFDALGPRTQQDVREVLGWACHQPWSDGRLALNGFSASAITIYNSLHLPLPCVKAAVLRSGTFDLYRDLLFPGAISNLIPDAGVLTLIGAPALAQGLDRLPRDPASGLDVAAGMFATGLSALQHPALDDFWAQRRFRGDVNHLPILMLDGFFDVESRGAFQAYQALRGDGAHLLLVGGHDGAPQGTDAGAGAIRAWLDHYVRGVDNGIDTQPRVRLLLSDGDREDYLAGHYVGYDGGDWPMPGTRWRSLALDSDGALRPKATGAPAMQPYPAIPSFTFNSDPPNAAIVGSAGFNALSNPFPILTDMTLAGTLARHYETAPLKTAVLSAGPLALDVRLSSTAPQTNIWAVVSDVSPDGTPHPLTAGRLNSDFPRVDRSRSLVDAEGRIVQPYGRFDPGARSPAPLAATRSYQIEFWPVGNRFRAGHRIRLDILGASGASQPSAPAINSVRAGSGDGSRLLVPVLPGSDLGAALRRR